MRHVILTCPHHPNLRWQCKEIAFTPGRGYNGARHIFYNGPLNFGPGVEWVDECKCRGSELILAPEEVEFQKTHPTYPSKQEA